MKTTLKTTNERAILLSSTNGMQNSANAIAAISNKRAENSMGKNNKVLY